MYLSEINPQNWLSLRVSGEKKSICVQKSLDPDQDETLTPMDLLHVTEIRRSEGYSCRRHGFQFFCRLPIQVSLIMEYLKTIWVGFHPEHFWLSAENDGRLVATFCGDETC